MGSALRLCPTALTCGPDPASSGARLIVEFSNAQPVSIKLDVAFAKALCRMLGDIVSGLVMRRAPSRQTLVLALCNEDDAADTQPPMALAGGNRS
jgi:hypothetical protein